ncbi:MAG: hypothetical protein QUS14_13780 [Pyrinomonadaceae bacterium]|nr:hypothetical protein [Pyrinomonadaceae bacterium]
MNLLINKILWVDCLGAIATGVMLIALSGWLGPLYGLPAWVVVAHGFVHMTYGTYSLSLAVRNRRPMSLIKLLVFANAGWAVLCVIFAGVLLTVGTGFAVAAFVVEGIYVGGLAMFEWNNRKPLAEPEEIFARE